MAEKRDTIEEMETSLMETHLLNLSEEWSRGSKIYFPINKIAFEILFKRAFIGRDNE